VKGLILASRSLHDDVENFRKAVRDHVHHVTVTDEDINSIWQREAEAKSFAVNGGCGTKHWAANMEMYRSLKPDQAPPKDFAEVSVPGVVEDVLKEIGMHSSHDSDA